MDRIYDNRKKTRDSAPKPEGKQPSLEALRTGAAEPSREQLGHRVDLPDAMREKMETAFGADLSAVKLYESETVSEAGAEAVAQGSNIAFAPGMVDFTSFGGQARLGHELSHVVSQARGEVTGSGLLNDPALEARADREGAMAASGQQISVPADAMSPVTASPAAGPMQCLGKKKEGPAPNGVDVVDWDTLKKNPDESTSVAKVDANGDGPAVLKMGTTPAWEKSMSQYHNLAGKTFSEMNSGDQRAWSFNAPDVRALTTKEKLIMKFRRMVGKKSEHLHSLSKQPTTRSEEREGASIFSWADGRSRPETGDKTEQAKLNPADPTEAANYQKMMGFIAMTDMATGNFDRLVGIGNLGNWTEDRQNRQVHLIDNDYDFVGGVGADVKSGGDRSLWLKNIKKYLGSGANEQDLGKRFIDKTTETGGNMFFEDLQGIFGDNTQGAVGANQAVQALPQMRAQLEAQFRQGNSKGELDARQTELLERMQIMEEFTSDRQMAPLYEQLADLGYSAKEGESQYISDLRSGILDRIKTLREQKRQQQG